MMHVVVLLARFTLGGMWITAALAKLASPVPRSQAVEEFGFVHGRPAQILGLALPYMELTLGLLLVTGEGIRVAAVASAFLLVAFSVAMLAILLQGRRVRCNCFGQLGDAYVVVTVALYNVRERDPSPRGGAASPLLTDW